MTTKNTRSHKSTRFLTMLLTDQAYHLYELFKQNAVIIRT